MIKQMLNWFRKKIELFYASLIKYFFFCSAFFSSRSSRVPHFMRCIERCAKKFELGVLLKFFNMLHPSIQNSLQEFHSGRAISIYNASLGTEREDKLFSLGLQSVFYSSFILLLILLPGCMMGPTYEKPATRMPATYTHSSYGGVANLARWWTFFNDSYLNELIQKAIKQNYDLRIALAKIEQTRNEFQIKQSDLFPEIDGVGLMTRNRYSYNIIQPLAASDLAQDTQTSQGFSFGNALENPYSFLDLGFDASWEIDFWGKLRHARNAAYDTYQAQIEEMRDVYIMLLAQVAKTYIEARTLQQRIDLTKKIVNLDVRFLQLTEDLFNAGLKSDIPDAQQIQIIEEEKKQLVQLELAFAQTVIELAVLLSESPEGFVFNDGMHKVPVSAQKLQVGLPSDLLRRRPDIRQAERELAAATENVGVAVGDFFPSFSLLGIVGAESFHASNWFSNCSLTWTVGPSMAWKLITFGRVYYNVEAKKAVQKQALLTYAKTIVGALGDVEKWLVAYFEQQQALVVLQKKMIASIREKDLVKNLFKSGLESELELLVTEKNNLQVELSVVATQQAVSTALVSVYKALGGGWEHVQNCA